MTEITFSDRLELVDWAAAEDPATVEETPDVQMGLAAVPDVERDESRGDRDDTREYGEGPPRPPRPPAGRRLPKRPGRGLRYFVCLMIFIVFSFIVGYILGAGFEKLYGDYMA